MGQDRAALRSTFDTVANIITETCDSVAAYQDSGEVLGGVGLRGILELDIAPRGRVPVMVRSEVTNQPAGSGASRGQDPSLAVNESVAAGDVGVRGILQVGYRFAPPLVVALRASYQGRTISHAGPGLGGAVEYRW